MVLMCWTWGRWAYKSCDRSEIIVEVKGRVVIARLAPQDDDTCDEKIMVRNAGHHRRSGGKDEHLLPRIPPVLGRSDPLLGLNFAREGMSLNVVLILWFTHVERSGAESWLLADEAKV